jgi:hypothetical protein
MALEIDERVRAFIQDHVGSIAELEVILLLRGDPGREWTAAEVAQTLRLGADWSRIHLARLAASGILTEQPGAPARYCLSRSSPGLAETLNAIAEAYAHRQRSIIQLIYANPDDKIRTFADAFKLRKEKDR